MHASPVVSTGVVLAARRSVAKRPAAISPRHACDKSFIQMSSLSGRQHLECPQLAFVLLWNGACPREEDLVGPNHPELRCSSGQYSWSSEPPKKQVCKGSSLKPVLKSTRFRSHSLENTRSFGPRASQIPPRFSCAPMTPSVNASVRRSC